jgi:hypothetical protein
MIAPNKTIIYICDNIEENSDIFKAIQEKLCEEIDCKYCKIIRNDDLFGIDDSGYNAIRFGCVTRKTPPILTDRLLTQEEAIPILLIDEDLESYRNELVKVHRMNSEYVKKMIYNVNSVGEISGAIKWVHNCYYQLVEKLEKRAEKKAVEIRELGKHIAGSTIP